MSKTRLFSGAFLLCAVAACQSPTQTLNDEQTAAVQTALARGKFELNCPTATGEVLSRNLINPVVNGPVMAGVQRAEYTIGVAGCGQRKVYISVCQVGSVSCVAAAAQS